MNFVTQNYQTKELGFRATLNFRVISLQIVAVLVKLLKIRSTIVSRGDWL